MSSPRQNANERRLAQLRVLKEEHFADDLTDEEIIEAKNARIELLEDEVSKLRKRINKLEAAQRISPRPSASQPKAPSPEAPRPSFDFYRT